MAKTLQYQGDVDTYDLQRKVDPLRLVLYSPSEKITMTMAEWLGKYNDIVIKGDGFTRNYHVICKWKDKKGKFRMDYIYE